MNGRLSTVPFSHRPLPAAGAVNGEDPPAQRRWIEPAPQWGPLLPSAPLRLYNKLFHWSLENRVSAKKGPLGNFSTPPFLPLLPTPSAFYLAITLIRLFRCRHPCARSSIHLSVRPSFHPSVRPSVHPSILPSVRPSVHLSFRV